MKKKNRTKLSKKSKRRMLVFGSASICLILFLGVTIGNVWAQIFQKYYEKNGTLGKELFFAGRDYLCLKDEDFRCFLEEYTALCRKYYEKESRDGKMLSISIISSPVQEEEK